MNLPTSGAARRALYALTMLALAVSLGGCFTAFTPKRDYCTHDPKDTAVPMCKPKAPPAENR